MNYNSNQDEIEFVLNGLLNTGNQYHKEIVQIEEQIKDRKKMLTTENQKSEVNNLHFYPRKIGEKGKDNQIIKDEIEFLNINLYKLKKLEEENRMSTNSLKKVYSSLFRKEYNCLDIRLNDNEQFLELIEGERQRIAADLHDSVVQDLIYIIHQTELIKRYARNDSVEVNLEIEDMKKNIKNVIDSMREKIYDLRPMTFDDLGWDSVFERLKESLCQNSNLNVYFEIDKPPLQQMKLIAIYRIVNEACINVKKHAKASNLKVIIKNIQEGVYLSIQDDGIGIDNVEDSKEKNHFGMKIMKENVKLLSGEFSIESNNIDGTKIIIKIPNE